MGRNFSGFQAAVRQHMAYVFVLRWGVCLLGLKQLKRAFDDADASDCPKTWTACMCYLLSTNSTVVISVIVFCMLSV